MAKKKKESLLGEISEAAAKIVKAAKVGETVKKKVEKTKKNIEKAIVSGILLGVGGIFVLVGIMQLLNEIYNIDFSAQFLGLGIISIIIGLVIKSSSGK